MTSWASHSLNRTLFVPTGKGSESTCTAYQSNEQDSDSKDPHCRSPSPLCCFIFIPLSLLDCGPRSPCSCHCSLCEAGVTSHSAEGAHIHCLVAQQGLDCSLSGSVRSPTPMLVGGDWACRAEGGCQPQCWPREKPYG